jgi:hypothetical protein
MKVGILLIHEPIRIIMILSKLEPTYVNVGRNSPPDDLHYQFGPSEVCALLTCKNLVEWFQVEYW